MRPISRPADIQLVQILGGVGNPTAAVYASHLISRLASLVGGQAAVGGVADRGVREGILLGLMGVPAPIHAAALR